MRRVKQRSNFSIFANIVDIIIKIKITHKVTLKLFLINAAIEQNAQVRSMTSCPELGRKENASNLKPNSCC